MLTIGAESGGSNPIKNICTSHYVRAGAFHPTIYDDLARSKSLCALAYFFVSSICELKAVHRKVIGPMNMS